MIRIDHDHHATRKPKKIDDAELQRLWKSHMPERLIAEKMGHHRSVLRRRAIKLGLPARREIWSQ
jgi:hypothetical protein